MNDKQITIQVINCMVRIIGKQYRKGGGKKRKKKTTQRTWREVLAIY